MKKLSVIIIVIIALVVGGGVGWALRGTQAGSPATTANTGSNQSGQQQASNTQTPSACAADGLTAKIAPASGGGAAGNRYYDLTITNSKSAGCTVDGYPGVSLLDSTGAAVGSPADKDTAQQPASFTLGSGQSATAVVKIAESGNYPDGTCTEGATTVKIYPPNATGYLTVPSDTITTWCPGFTTTSFSLS